MTCNEFSNEFYKKHPESILCKQNGNRLDYLYHYVNRYGVGKADELCQELKHLNFLSRNEYIDLYPLFVEAVK